MGGSHPMNTFTRPAAWAVQCVTVVLSVLVGLVTLAPAFTMAAFEAKVVGVADGDRLTVLQDQVEAAFALCGIEALGARPSLISSPTISEQRTRFRAASPHESSMDMAR